MESNLSDLEKLDDLRQKGILTEAEFQTKKTQILNQFGENKINQAKQSKKLKDEKNAKGCMKFFLIIILVFFILVFIIIVFGGNNKNSKTDSIVETSQSSTTINEIAKLEKELENNKLTKVQREEIEIEIKSIRTLEFAEKNISAWDRSNPKLVHAIKKTMNSPDSFEHIETTFDYKKNKVEATMTFRGNNAVGGTVLNVVKGIFDYDGNLLEIKDTK
ncbi:hypothetical protein B0A69_20450 [Chryseobacterium shigense]|uniref:Short C-terminal domain-containing protein n=1 Tax=Chryseobacterium shigense TaxID=297244 RepID=A0A1N7I0S1_9FLAO|nr:SHOCT domain-containing protein [Chryseobacterium shigense]PQA90699.1 hypothetical protein B0A69_20450 [Chryseobacterium shigense]SIS30631.1 Short C-terminal domain-containing protein [Chryseobacterium shigense]